MNKKIKILSLLFFALIIALTVNAQDKGKNIPLFDNIQSDDANIPAMYNNELKIAVPQSYSDIKVSEAISVLKSLYSAGKITEAIEFSELIQKHFRRSDDQGRDYMIYKLSALKDGGFDHQADSMVLSFRKKFPFYKIKKDDPLVFKNLMTNYYTRPLFSFGVSVSKLFPTLKIDTVYSMPGGDTVKNLEYKDFKYIMNDLSIQWYATQKFSVSIAVAYSMIEFTRTAGYMTHTEKTNYLAFPVKFGYALRPVIINELTPEVFVGLSPGLKYKKTYDVSGFAKKNKPFDADPDTVSTFYQNRHKQFNCTAIVGARLNYQLKRFCFFVQWHCGCALNSFTDPKERYAEKGLAFNNEIVSDAARLLETGISAGFKVNFCYKTFPKYDDYGY